MLSKKIPVNVYVERIYCDCGEELIRNDVVLTTYPCQYTYYCPKCGHCETSVEQYPKISFQDENGRVI